MPTNHDIEVFEKQEMQEISQERRAVRMVRDFMDRSIKYRRPFIQLAQQSRTLYECWSNAGRSIVQRANLKLPYGYSIIETQTPMIVDMFARHDYVIKFEGYGPEDWIWDDLLADHSRKQLSRMEFKSKFPAYVKSMLLDGTAIAKIPYIYKEMKQTRRISEIDPQTGIRSTTKQTSIETDFDGPGFEVIPIYDFFPDWHVRNPGSIQDMRGLVHRTWKTLASLKAANQDRDTQIYKNLDDIRSSLDARTDAWKPPTFSDNFKAQFERLQDLESGDSGIKDSGSVEIWEYWGLFDPAGDGNFEEYIITIAHGDVVIRMRPNFYDYKFKPFVATPNVIRSNEFYGIPELTAVRSLLKEVNTIRNARLDVLNLSVNPMWIAEKGLGINKNALYSRPGGVIWANDINGIKPIQLGDPSVGSFKETQEIQQDIQNATAQLNSPAALGKLSSTFGRSATGTQFIQSMARGRTGLKAQLLSELMFKPMARIMMMTNRQFTTDMDWVRSTNPNSPRMFEELPPDAFFRHYDFAVKTDLDTGGPEGEFQKMQMMTQWAGMVEQSQPGTIKFDELTEAVFRPLVGSQVGRFVRSEEERQMIIQRQLAQQQAIQAEQGRGAPQPNQGNVPGKPGGRI